MKKLLAWSTVYFVVMLSCILLSPHAMDADDNPPGLLGQGAALLGEVLIQPALWGWAWIESWTGAGSWLQWVVFFANCILWGAMLMGLQALLSSRRRS